MFPAEALPTWLGSPGLLCCQWPCKALHSVFRRQWHTTVVGVGCTIVPVSKELVLTFGVDMHVDRTRAGSNWASPVAPRSVGTL